MDKVAGYSLVGLLTGAVALKKLAGAAAAAVVAKKAGLLAVLAVKALKLWKLLLAASRSSLWPFAGSCRNSGLRSLSPMKSNP